ncbi:N-acetylglucosamine-6-phosphate deacetylase [Halomicronema hongdechloris]|nr:N-acetylglucosamine-6-phosphate deacetylase [Halomicronema hongdechloris]
MYALTPATLYTGQQQLSGQALLIEGQHIMDVVPVAVLAAACPRVPLPGQQVAPGFIDLQLNGCGGVLFNDAITAETLDRMHRTNLRSGTTSFLPTLITTSDDAMEQAMAVVQAYRQHYPQRVLGLHLEGPYLNPQRRGIHDGRHVRPVDEAMLARIAQYGGDTVTVVTLAPDITGSEPIHCLSQAGIVVSAGHSNASYEQALAGFEAGITMVTHLFNAMSPWHSRQPGLVAAALSRPEVYAGIIADGLHVHFGSVALAKQIKGDRLLLVSDAMPPVGTQMFSFWIGQEEVFYRQGKCVAADGTLGGSALTLMAAVANCVQQLRLPLAEALRMASLYPARAIAQDHHLGLIAPGYLANLVIFDQSLRVTAIVDRGQLQLFDAALEGAAL